MSGCTFCQHYQNHDRNISETCAMSYGKPCVACMEYLEVEAEIEKSRQRLEEQLVRRRRIQEKINKIHDPLVTRVPREVTTYIFELAVSVDPSEDGARKLYEGELYEPLPLGKVCRQWRDIAWGMPQLWTFMFANIPSVRHLPARLDVATRWLQRSGEYLPLSIHFRIKKECKHNDEDPESEEFLPFINLLNVYSHRWKDLCGLSPAILFEYLATDSTQVTPPLRKLQISATDNLGVPLVVEPQRQRPQLLQPRHLQLDNHIHGCRLAINWGQVTHLETNCPWGISLFTLLPKLPELKDLKVYDMIGRDKSNRRRKIISHPKLQSFSLNCSFKTNPHKICAFLGSLMFPSLQHLVFNFLGDESLLDAVVRFLQRSSCSLVSLSVLHAPGGQDENFTYLSLLQCVDSLEELEISVFMNKLEAHDFFGHLLCRIRPNFSDPSQSTSTIPFPKLQRLKYMSPYPKSVPWELFFLLFSPAWSANGRKWKSLSVVDLSISTPSRDVLHNLVDHSERLKGLLEILDAGIELFLPKRVSKDNVLTLLEKLSDEDVV